MSSQNGDKLVTLSALNALEQRLEQRLDNKIGSVQTGLSGLDRKIQNAALSLIQTQAEVREIKATMATKTDVDRIITILDFMSGKTVDQDRTVIVFDKILKDHELRIKRLEAQA